MILFVFPTHASMGSELAPSLGIRLGQFSVDRFPNQEVHAVIQTNVASEECLILGTIAPPDEQLLSTLLLSHTLKKEGRATSLPSYRTWPMHVMTNRKRGKV